MIAFDFKDAFKAATFASREPLPTADQNDPIIRSCRRTELGKAITARPTTMFRAALESIDAGTSLLASGQLSQAFMLLMQALEVSLKGVLDEIYTLGVSSWAAKNPSHFRKMAQLSHGSLPDKATIRQVVKKETFIGALRRVKDILALSPALVEMDSTLNDVRNKIAHQGGEPEQANLYLELILETLIPLLDEVYSTLIDCPISSWIGHRITRELVVAGRYLRCHRSEPGAWAIALRPLAAADFSCFREFGAPVCFDPHDTGVNLRDDSNYKWEASVAEEFRTKVDLEVLEDEWTSCRICGERCFLATDGTLKWDNGVPFFDILAMRCAYCHLSVSEQWSELAQLHYGRIDEQLLGHEGWLDLLKHFHIKQKDMHTQ